MQVDPTTLIGKKVPSADGSDCGLLIVGFCEQSNDFQMVSIRWSTGEPLQPTAGLEFYSAVKASYRYQLDKAV